jgi:hypothetical protein
MFTETVTSKGKVANFGILLRLSSSTSFALAASYTLYAQCTDAALVLPLCSCRLKMYVDHTEILEIRERYARNREFYTSYKVHWLAVPIVRSMTSEDPTCDGLLMPEANCTSSYRATYILMQDLSFQREIRGSYTQ